MKSALAMFTVGAALAIGSSALAQGDATSAITTKIHLNDVLGMQMSNGCHYVSKIAGDIIPKTDGQSKAKTGTIDAALTVDTSLACPQKNVVHAVQTIRESGPLTKAELERTLERSGSIVSDASGKTCLYRPELFFVKGKLTSGRVILTCPPPQDAQ